MTRTQTQLKRQRLRTYFRDFKHRFLARTTPQTARETGVNPSRTPFLSIGLGPVMIRSLHSYQLGP